MSSVLGWRHPDKLVGIHLNLIAVRHETPDDYARLHGPWPVPEGTTVDVPTGYAAFPREILRPPRSVAERTYTDIRRWAVMERGGHFAAPHALAREIVEFFSALG